MTKQFFKKILIANRGEIACRIMRSAQSMGIRTVAVYSDADAHAMHVRMADEAYHIGPAPAAESYLIADNILAVAKENGVDAIHPGYGFLSENADFADACVKNKIAFIGPSGDAIRAMGLKGAAKNLMVDAGVPVVPGYHGDNQDAAHLKAEAKKIGYPVLIKAVAGGGGKGMRLVEKAADFDEGLASAKREGENSFGNGIVLIEKYITKPRHIEIQVFADNHGDAVHLFERDCSLQRRHQKVVEEAPAPDMPEDMRAAMGDAAVRAAKAIGYSGAGTIEFIVDSRGGLSKDGFYFMEMNTRLQVEHPVTEMITGVDLVDWQIRVAAGEPLPLTQDDLHINGHAVEVRLYAEDPAKNFMPQTGALTCFRVEEAPGLRLETGVDEGDEVSIYYDPMIAKLVTHGDTRDEAMRRMAQAIRGTRLAGLKSNLSFLLACVENQAFLDGDIDTGFIEKHMDSLLPNNGVHSEDIALITLAYVKQRSNNAEAEAMRSNDPYSPWNDQGGWRTNLNYKEPLSFLVEDGDDITVFVTPKGDGYSIEVDGETFTVEGAMDFQGELDADINGKEVMATINIVGSTISLMRDGYTTALTLKSQTGNAEENAEAPGALIAPMPGRILEVLVADGDTVEHDQPLIIMEAMKMEYTLKAPRTGVIENLQVETDTQVADGGLILNVSDA
jgi:3-methylcrotonyl-CoA carboxylase alpha subunit